LARRNESVCARMRVLVAGAGSGQGNRAHSHDWVEGIHSPQPKSSAGTHNQRGIWGDGLSPPVSFWTLRVWGGGWLISPSFFLDPSGLG
jgi:hypothetical protein